MRTVSAGLSRFFSRRGAGDEREGLAAGWQGLLFVVLFFLVFSRRPGDLLHAQFYAEDGKRWFAQAYNLHWLPSLLIPDSSYLQILPRLAAGVALLLPLRWAPLMMNLIGCILQVLPVTALLSRRCSNWGSLPMRLAMAAIYLANPNAIEVHVNVTNAQWHLALLQVLVAFGSPPKSWIGKGSDLCLFVVGAFSGPFDIVLLPLVLIYWWKQRERWSLTIALCLMIGGVFQVHSIAAGANFVAPYDTPQAARLEASRLPLGASPSMFLRIVGGDVIFNSVIGASRVEKLPVVINGGCVLLGALIVGCGFVWGPLAFRLFFVYAVAWFAAALTSPVAFDSVSRWHGLLLAAGLRYYLFPSLLFLWAAVYCASRVPVRLIRGVGWAVLVLLALGVPRSWKYSPYPDHHFETYVDQFDKTKRGDVISIPIQPDPWRMNLIKR